MRHFVLVAYDVSDDKRLRKMFKLMKGYGDHIQYSVFLCRLSDMEKVTLIEKIRDVIHHNEDQTILITLGPVQSKHDARPKDWEVIGLPLTDMDRSVMIY